MSMDKMKVRKGTKGAHEAYLQGAKGMAEKSETATNIEVGNFLSELMLALRYREKGGMVEGEWLEDPERAYTDGLAFGTEIQVAAQMKLQITLSLDTSLSMWNMHLMGTAGMTFMAIDKMIRTAAEELSPGTLMYQPFVFNKSAARCPRAFMKNYQHTEYVSAKGNTRFVMGYERPDYIMYQDAVEQGDLTEEEAQRMKASDFTNWAQDTLFAPLFEQIEAWENEHGDPSAQRLDLVITDGYFEHAADTDKVSRIQDRRNGKLTTLFLNFLPSSQWSTKPMPDRCLQVPVTKGNLTAELRNAIVESVNEML